jgi:hypothetical protein
MTVFLTNSLLFGVAFLSHLILWRVRRPKHDYKVLLVIFGIVFSARLLRAVSHSTAVWELLHTAIFYTAICLAYMVAYSSVEGDSPTLSLVRFIAERRATGRSHDEVRQFFAQRPFTKRRLASLMDAGLIREQNGKYFVAGRGSLAFRFILAYRKIYGDLPRGG